MKNCQICAQKPYISFNWKYANDGSGDIRIPCLVRRTQDELYDPALVVITKLPPIQQGRKRVLLGNNNDSIGQSDLALPLRVHIATLHADEINTGFAPTLVKSRDNQYFVLNWTVQIFS
jgi:hypothetical protein